MKKGLFEELSAVAEGIKSIDQSVEDVKAKKHPFGKFGKSILLPNGILYSPSPSTVHYAINNLLPFLMDWYIKKGKMPSHDDIRVGMDIKSTDRIRKLLHILIGLGYIGKSLDTGAMYPIGEADQATAAGILAKIDKGFIERLSVLSKKDRMLVLSLIKYTAKSKWILPK